MSTSAREPVVTHRPAGSPTGSSTSPIISSIRSVGSATAMAQR